MIDEIFYGVGHFAVALLFRAYKNRDVWLMRVET